MEVEVNELINEREIVIRRVQKVLEVAQGAQIDPNKFVEFQVRYDSLSS